MTQAFNLSQLANNVDTNGDLNAAVGLYNQVPVANGGTGAATLTANAVLIGNGTSAVTTVAAGTAGNVLTSNGTTWTSAANPASSNVNAMTVGTASGTWTKPATVKSIRVTVVGAGGGGSNTTYGSNTIGYPGGGGGTAIRYYPAASLPGPQPYTVGTGAGNTAGGTTSFGVSPVTVVSATGGTAGVGNNNPLGATVAIGGTGSNGNINIQGGRGIATIGGASSQGFGAIDSSAYNVANSRNGDAGQVYGGGGGGANYGPSGSGLNYAGGAGGAGVVIIEEFY
jgi:hypothetical protein